MQAFFTASIKTDCSDTQRMNSLHSALVGLLSSLLLSVGFSRLAARFDQLNLISPLNAFRSDDRRSAAFCTSFCALQEV